MASRSSIPRFFAIILTFSFLIASFFSFLCLNSPVFANSNTDSNTNSNANSRSSLPALQISPTQTEIDLSPSTTYHGTFTASISGDEPIEVVFSASAYYPADTDYNPDYSASNVYTQIANWVTFDETGATLYPDQEYTIGYTITVPADVPAGGQYAALFVQTVESAGSNFAATSRVGMLLLAQVDGETRTAAELLSQSAPSLAINSQASFQTSIKNTGNVDFRVISTLTLQDFFTNQYAYDNTDEPLTASILPETTRLIALSPDDLPTFGLFRATYTVTYLGEDHVLSQVILIAPLWLLLLIIFFIAFLIIFIILTINHKIHRRRQGF